MILKLLYIIYLKSAIIMLRFLFVLGSNNSFAMSMVESLSFLSLGMSGYLIVPGSSLNGPKDLSPTAVVAGFTKISLITQCDNWSLLTVRINDFLLFLAQLLPRQ